MVLGPLHRFLSSQTLSVTRASFSSAVVFGAYYARPRLPSCRMLQDRFRDEIPASVSKQNLLAPSCTEYVQQYDGLARQHPKQTVTRASASTLLSYAQHLNFPEVTQTCNSNNVRLSDGTFRPLQPPQSSSNSDSSTPNTLDNTPENSS